MLMWIMMPGCAIILFVMWFVLGRDKKTVTAITVSPPAGLDPLEMEYAQIVTITDRGIFAMLLYWVSKGILEVVEQGERIGMKKIAALPADAPEHAVFLYDSLYRKQETVYLDKLPPELADHKGELCEKVGKRFTGKNAVVANDDMVATLIAIGFLIIAIFYIEVTVDVPVLLAAILGVVLFCVLCLLQNGALGFQSKYDRFEVWAGGVGLALVLIVHIVLLMRYTGDAGFTALFTVCFLICVPCIMFMERRVNHGLYGRILGFRTFIETAEWERLKKLSEDDPNYGMDILPYAMLFNMGTAWTKQFENKTIYSAVEQMEANVKE